MVYNEFMNKKLLIEKFNSRINKTSSCWLWLGEKTSAGYGLLNQMEGGKRYRVYAHRLSAEINIGIIPKKMEVCHTCDNPSCVNPAHLFIGTHKQNMLDMCKKGRWKAGPPTGVRNPSAKLNEEKVLIIRNKYLLGQSMRSLAKEYNVSKFAIFSIIHKITWKNI